MKNVYYASLVRWEVVEEIILLVDPEERDEVQKLVIGSIDHIVMETVLLHLDKEHHQEFLEKIHNSYHDEGILDWLKEKVHGIEEILTFIIRETKSSIRDIIK